MKFKFVFWLLALVVIWPTHASLPFTCNDLTFACIGEEMPAIRPDFSVWTTPKELQKFPTSITIKTKRDGLTCKPVTDPQKECSIKWPNSQPNSESNGFFNQIYVKMPGSSTYSLKTEPIDLTAYNALKGAYVTKETSLLRRLLPGGLTKIISTGYGYLQEQKNPAKTATHINDLLKPFGYSWDGTKASIIDAEKTRYAQALGVNPNEWIVPAGGYQTFNDFFIHQLKPGSRSIEGTGTDISSPADSKLTILENVSDTITLFNVKQQDFTLEKFLGNTSLAREFDGGTLMIFRLSPYNYHRYHTPVDGTPLAAQIIKKLGFESVDPITYKTGIDPLIINKRVLIPLETTSEKVLVVVVGAFNVGSINNTYTPGELLHRGAELGYFSYGGSTLVVVFKKGAITVDPTMLNYSRQGYETVVKMGQRVATFLQAKK